jgi:hypothetical protein
MDGLRNGIVIVALAAAVALAAGCETSPMQKAGERVDRAIEVKR